MIDACLLVYWGWSNWWNRSSISNSMLTPNWWVDCYFWQKDQAPFCSDIRIDDMKDEVNTG